MQTRFARNVQICVCEKLGRRFSLSGKNKKNTASGNIASFFILREISVQGAYRKHEHDRELWADFLVAFCLR